MSALVDLATVVLQLTGAGLALIGAVGIHRFRDPFSRMHAAAKPVTLGLILIAAGTVLQTADAGDVVKVALAVTLQLVTAPLGMHLLGRAAYRAGLLDPAATIDEYRRDLDGPDRLDGPDASDASDASDVSDASDASDASTPRPPRR
ncbi:MAG: monovalent cation/H(+) antiporter subunit G [Acidimicrobiales bacterium]